jgi:hypothetical protein
MPPRTGLTHPRPPRSPQPAPPPPSRITPAEKTAPVHGPRCKFVFPPKKDGEAVYEYPNPYFKYTGDWKSGIKDGKGVFQIGPNSFYSGDFINGEITGTGKRVFANGNTYEGEFQDGEFTGRGLYKDVQTGEEYEGDWKDNRRHGEGVLKLADGTVYRGHFENHRRNGHGEYSWEDGRSYVGEWQDNRIQGKGTMNYANGDQYVGDFVDGKRHGHGTIQWGATGLVFEGEWVNDTSAYQPTGLELSELPPITPGVALSGIVISVVGGAGENGRVLRAVIEIGKLDPNATQKKAPKAKKADSQEHEPKFMILNAETGDTFVDLTVENGRATLPAIPVPLDTEPNTFTLTVTDQSADQPLPEVTGDFAWVNAGSAGIGSTARGGVARGVRRGGPSSRNSERKSVRGGK